MPVTFVPVTCELATSVPVYHRLYFCACYHRLYFCAGFFVLLQTMEGYPVMRIYANHAKSDPGCFRPGQFGRKISLTIPNTIYRPELVLQNAHGDGVMIRMIIKKRLPLNALPLKSELLIHMNRTGVIVEHV